MNNRTLIEFVEEVLKPNFDGNQYNVTGEEIKEYGFFVRLSERSQDPILYRGHPLVVKETK